MSKSFNITFSQSFKVNIAEEAIQSLRAELSKSIEYTDANPGRTTDAQRARVQVVREWLAKGDDEFLSLFLRSAFRDGFRDEFMETVRNEKLLNATKFAPATVEVTPRGN